MKIRTLGLYAQELEAGPFTFLLSHSIPVAYRDARSEATPPGLYRTDAKFARQKAVTRHINKWLAGRAHTTIPHSIIVRIFEGLDRFSSGAVPPPNLAEALEYLAGLRSGSGT